MLWILKRDKQYLTFIDPKGIVRGGIPREKINLHIEIKELEKKMKEKDADNSKNIILNSVILSDSSFSEVKNINYKKQEDLENKNVLFLDDPNLYPKLLSKIL